MRRTLVLAFPCLIVALVTPSPADAQVRTIRTSFENFFVRVVDNPPVQTAPTQAPSPGDVVISRGRFRSGGRIIGYDRTVCRVVDWPNVLCTLSISLPGGKLISRDQFNTASRATQRQAIIGGTGAYRNARGDIAVRQTGQDTGTAVFTIIT
jgi:hypothetical protein